MDKLIVMPENVRGLGNILSSKTLNDFAVYNSNIQSSTGEVNGISRTVFAVSYDSNAGIVASLELEGSASECHVGDTVILACTVCNSNDNGVPGKTINFYDDSNNLLGSAVSSVDGVARFNYRLTGVGDFEFVAKYETHTSNQVVISCSRQDTLINMED